MNALKANEVKIKDEIKSLQTKLQETKDYLSKLENADSNLEKEAYIQAQVREQYEVISQRGDVPIPLLNENGQIVGYNSSFSRDVRTAVRTITDNVVSKHGVPIYQASLPETGESDTAIYTLSGITFLALAGVMRKKKL